MTLTDLSPIAQAVVKDLPADGGQRANFRQLLAQILKAGEPDRREASSQASLALSYLRERPVAERAAAQPELL